MSTLANREDPGEIKVFHQDLLSVSVRLDKNGSVRLRFYLLMSPCLCVISILYLDLYVLGGDALIS